MKKSEFLSELKNSLQGYMKKEEIEANIRFYDEYITNKVQKDGVTEKVAIENLGSPRLIAKTLIDTADENRTYASSYDYEEEYDSIKGFKATRSYFEKLKLNFKDIFLKLVFDRESLTLKEQIILAVTLFSGALIFVGIMMILYELLKPIIHILLLIFLMYIVYRIVVNK